MGAFPYCLRVPSGFGGIAGFDLNTSHVFSQVLLAVITLIVGVAGDVGTRAGYRFELRLPLCSVAVSALLGLGVGSVLLV